MPRRATSVRTTRSSKRKHLRNRKVKDQIKKVAKKFQVLLAAKNTTEAKSLLPALCSSFDKAAKKNIMHPRTADRKKSRLMKRLAKTA